MSKTITLSDKTTISIDDEGKVYIDTAYAFEACSFQSELWNEYKRAIETLISERKRSDIP